MPLTSSLVLLLVWCAALKMRTVLCATCNAQPYEELRTAVDNDPNRHRTQISILGFRISEP